MGDHRQFRLRNGTVVQFPDTMSNDEIRSFFDQRFVRGWDQEGQDVAPFIRAYQQTAQAQSPDETERERMSRLEAMGRGALDEFTFGAADEIAGLTAAGRAGPQFGERFQDERGNWLTDGLGVVGDVLGQAIPPVDVVRGVVRTALDDEQAELAFEQGVQPLRQGLAQAHEDRPYYTAAGSIAGAIVPALATRGRSLPATFGRLASRGAADGALYEFNSAEGNFLNRATRAVEGGIMGGLAAPLTHYGLDGLGRLAHHASRAVRRRTADPSQIDWAQFADDMGVGVHAYRHGGSSTPPPLPQQSVDRIPQAPRTILGTAADIGHELLQDGTQELVARQTADRIEGLIDDRWEDYTREVEEARAIIDDKVASSPFPVETGFRVNNRILRGAEGISFDEHKLLSPDLFQYDRPNPVVKPDELQRQIPNPVPSPIGPALAPTVPNPVPSPVGPVIPTPLQPMASASPLMMSAASRAAAAPKLRSRISPVPGAMMKSARNNPVMQQLGSMAQGRPNMGGAGRMAAMGTMGTGGGGRFGGHVANSVSNLMGMRAGQPVFNTPSAMFQKQANALRANIHGHQAARSGQSVGAGKPRNPSPVSNHAAKQNSSGSILGGFFSGGKGKTGGVGGYYGNGAGGGFTWG